MNPFYWFLVIVVVLFLGVGFAIRDSLRNILSVMATNAQTFAIVYVKGFFYTFVAMAVSFREVFNGVSTDGFTWLDWVTHYLVPLIAGANAILAFLDRSAERARDERDEKAAAGATPAPLIPPVPPQPPEPPK